ncbi:hypothetical protein Z043_114505 [Scleropages formosus]|uniref:BROMI C-terminal Rab TBC-like domain-containing protein n=1 Tax=Scleropages formosus TaxID=113540 RepID=A0A0P7YI48_SCLFO|nr:hypothetical protein Z043_114505 [Scleropages formosus]
MSVQPRSRIMVWAHEGGHHLRAVMPHPWLAPIVTGLSPDLPLRDQVQPALPWILDRSSAGLRGRFPGYDWFAATAFLLMSGDRERTWGFLLRFSSLLASAFLWPARLRAAAHLPKELARSEIPPVYSCTAHFVEMLLKAEVPLVSSAFQMSGFTPSQVPPPWTPCPPSINIGSVLLSTPENPPFRGLR